jgi:hypothetical protein
MVVDAVGFQGTPMVRWGSFFVYPVSDTIGRMLERGCFILVFRMSIRWVCRISLLIVLLHLNAGAAEKQYQKGQIVDLQQKTNTRILYYIADTPITKDEPYFELSVQSGSVLYLGKYVPRHADEILPAEWQPGATVEMRTDAHELYLRKYSGVEIEFAIVKRTAIAKSDTNKPSTATDGK